MHTPQERNIFDTHAEEVPLTIYVGEYRQVIGRAKIVNGEIYAEFDDPMLDVIQRLINNRGRFSIGGARLTIKE